MALSEDVANSSVAIVLLAAGRSSRMPGGLHKLLATFDGTPLMRVAATAAVNSKSIDVVVVTGWRGLEIQAAIEDLKVNIVHNAKFTLGMATSIAEGVKAAEKNGPDGILIALADMPQITTDHYDFLIDAFVQHGSEKVIRAMAGGEPGNPVVFPRRLFAHLTHLNGDKGARSLIEATKDQVVDIEIGVAALLDVDTLEAIIGAGGIVHSPKVP